jgi:hypothetical protein
MCFATKPGPGRSAAFVTKSVRTCLMTHIHGGGCSPLEKLTSRQKIAASEIGKEGVPIAKVSGPVVGPPSKESPGPSVSTTSTGSPMVITLGLGSPVVVPPSK